MQTRNLYLPRKLCLVLKNWWSEIGSAEMFHQADSFAINKLPSHQYLTYLFHSPLAGHVRVITASCWNWIFSIRSFWSIHQMVTRLWRYWVTVQHFHFRKAKKAEVHSSNNLQSHAGKSPSVFHPCSFPPPTIQLITASPLFSGPWPCFTIAPAVEPQRRWQTQATSSCKQILMENWHLVWQKRP